jgi:hypothetical protein
MKKLLLLLVLLLPALAWAQDYQADTTDSLSPGEGILGMITGAILLFIYFIPAYVGRKHPQSDAIVMLNLFLGWTLFGWVVALVWATTQPKPKQVVTVVAPAASTADELQKLHALRESGVLTDEEMQVEKAKILARK